MAYFAADSGDLLNSQRGSEITLGGMKSAFKFRVPCFLIAFVCVASRAWSDTVQPPEWPGVTLSGVHLMERDVRFDLALVTPADAQSVENCGRFRLVLLVANFSSNSLVIPIGKLELQVSDAVTGLVFDGKNLPAEPHLTSPAVASLKLAPGSTASISLDGLRSYSDGGGSEYLLVNVLGKRWSFRNPDFLGMGRPGKPDSVVVTFDNTPEGGNPSADLSPNQAAAWIGKVVLPPLDLREIRPAIPMMGPIF